MSAPPTLSATWQEADDLRAQGNFVAARELLEPAADVAAIRLGPDDPAVVETQRRLATVHRELGELTAARRVLEEALDGGLHALGDADPLILLISAELGAIADELGNKHEARRNLARVARYGPTVLGADHPYVRTSQRYLGMEVPPVPVSTGPPEPAWYPADQAQPTPPVAGPAQAPPAVVPVEPGVYRPVPREDPDGPDGQVPGPEPEWTDQATLTDRGPVPPQSGAIPAQPTGPTQPGPPIPATQPGPVPPRPGTLPTQPGVPPQPGTMPVPPMPPGAPRGPIGPGTMPSQRPAAAWYPEQATEARPAEAPYDWAAPGADWAPDAAAEAPRRTRGPLIAMALITVAVVVVGVVIGLVVFHHPSGSGAASKPPASSAPARLAPTGVQLRDDGASVTLTWTDPTSGRVPFVIAGGRAGQASQAFQTLPPGQATYTVNGLNPSVDYCFTVVAVYNTNEVATSALVCTQRTGPATPSPSH